MSGNKSQEGRINNPGIRINGYKPAINSIEWKLERRFCSIQKLRFWNISLTGRVGVKKKSTQIPHKQTQTLQTPLEVRMKEIDSSNVMPMPGLRLSDLAAGIALVAWKMSFNAVLLQLIPVKSLTILTFTGSPPLAVSER